jgi:hypothetical protein
LARRKRKDGSLQSSVRSRKKKNLQSEWKLRVSGVDPRTNVVPEMPKQVSLVSAACKCSSSIDCSIASDRSVTEVWSAVHVSSIRRTPLTDKRDWRLRKVDIGNCG